MTTEDKLVKRVAPPGVETLAYSWTIHVSVPDSIMTASRVRLSVLEGYIQWVEIMSESLSS